MHYRILTALFLISTGFFASAAAQAGQGGGPGPTPSAPAFPVVLNNDTLFYYEARFGPFSAAERASAVRLRLERIFPRLFAAIQSDRSTSIRSIRLQKME